GVTQTEANRVSVATSIQQGAAVTDGADVLAAKIYTTFAGESAASGAQQLSGAIASTGNAIASGAQGVVETAQGKSALAAQSFTSANNDLSAASRKLTQSA